MMLTKNWKIFTEVYNLKPILKFLKTSLALLKKTYLKNQPTKPVFQITINIVQKHSQKQHTIKSIMKLQKTERANYSNLPVKEQKSLQGLKYRNDIVILEADKGSAVVILDAEVK